MVAWLPYLPIPGLGWVAAMIAPDDAHVRYHAWQGGTLVILAYLSLLVVGLLGMISDAAWYAATIGTVAGLVFLAATIGVVWGIVSAARGRYARIRPAWDVAAMLAPRE